MAIIFIIIKSIRYEDGSIDLVSEYVSSTRVAFKGKEGYKNYIGTLNRIAKIDLASITIAYKNPSF